MIKVVWVVISDVVGFYLVESRQSEVVLHALIYKCLE